MEEKRVKHELVKIALEDLLWMLPPAAMVLWVLWRWGIGAGNALYALGRMLVQLLLIGYLLVVIFATQQWSVVLAVLAVMLFFSSWIALRTVPEARTALLGRAVLSILTGGGTTLALVAGGVLHLEPWYRPEYLIPLAGMVFANAMNSVSLAAERFFSEDKEGQPLSRARQKAMGAAMIPVLNALFAVGLVSLPGMMTGQILSGVSPLIAARYQIMVMLMIFSASGLSAALFLTLLKRKRP